MAANESQENRARRLADMATDTLGASGNCAQTSFAVLQEEFDLDGGQILKALTPFPGIALRGEACGAVIGSLMALGLVYGRDELDDWKGFISSLPSARRFCRSFEEMHGSTSCSEILELKLGQSYNLADRAESLEYLSAGGQQKCGELIASAVEIAAEMIEKKG